MKDKKQFVIPLLLLIILSSSLLTSSRLAEIRSVDIVQLIAVGLVLGIFLVRIIDYLRRK